MAVPDFQSFFKPLLDVAADGKEHSMKEARRTVLTRCDVINLPGIPRFLCF
ncbi:MAG: hypothetical protein OEW15_12310 [Nitrospirota bacterium]|nr:hypothetical protein [Nitrospirota bacterium]